MILNEGASGGNEAQKDPNGRAPDPIASPSIFGVNTSSGQNIIIDSYVSKMIDPSQQEHRTELDGVSSAKIEKRGLDSA
jgi:hypothetical protein